MHPVMMVGGALFGLGFVVFFALLVANGGLAKSKQFAVLGDLLGGKKGRGAQLGTILAMGTMSLGALACFAGVAAGDARRREACEVRCAEDGFASGRIGPNADRTKDRKTWWVACICEGPDRETVEIRADHL